ncbi:MAG: transglycosylase SLT domain-containing protein [Prolixibacteraceae bacterium]|nr:transglycosylase SLT domain-containing protein [Prolixibacteraceae bacterium]MBN2649907.1 transglycosylase SLT domain-containing protein [Prolixibacteraceae bacterium]
MRKALLIVFISTITLSVFSHTPSDKEPVIARPMKRIEIARIDTSGILDTFMAYPDEMLETILSQQMDSLINNWYIRNAYNIDSMVLIDTMSIGAIPISELENPSKKTNIPDSVYIERLQALNSYIDLSYNKTVRNVIELYTEKRRGQVEIMLGLANYYFPMFEEILDKYNMPLELKYMAIIESALNARAYSHAGACGLWQFMYGTGKMYGLEITTFVDERRDPVKATEAAARYLSDLYNIYKDWHLVIAAYNCGPGNVNKAIRRSGGKRDYWTIYYRLPRETRGYVPAFIAATYTMNYYKIHNLQPQQPSFNIITDTLMVSDYLHLEQVAYILNADIEMLREINPMYRLDVIPATPSKPYPIRLPHEMVNKFIDFETQIFAWEHEKYFPNNQIKNPSQTAYQYVPVDVKGKAIVYYTVKTGDNVGFIAEWFNVRASDLRYWNNIRGNLIRVGQKLVVYVPEQKENHYSQFNQMSFAEKQKAIGKSSNTTASSAPAEPIDPSYEYYTVRQGDNLWEIAKKFPGISASDIQKINQMGSSTSLDIGQRLKIQKR